MKFRIINPSTTILQSSIVQHLVHQQRHHDNTMNLKQTQRTSRIRRRFMKLGESRHTWDFGDCSSDSSPFVDSKNRRNCSGWQVVTSVFDFLCTWDDSLNEWGSGIEEKIEIDGGLNGEGSELEPPPHRRRRSRFEARRRRPPQLSERKKNVSLKVPIGNPNLLLLLSH